MKKFFIYSLLGAISLALVGALVIIVILFAKPHWIISPKNIARILDRTDQTKGLSWAHAQIDHEWIKWNKRRLSGHFKDLCFVFESETFELDTCLAELSWDVGMSFKWPKGLSIRDLAPVKIVSHQTVLTLKHGEKNDTKKGPPPDIWKFWKTLWSENLPRMDIQLDKILLRKGKMEKEFNLKLAKSAQKIKGEFWKLGIFATPSELEVTYQGLWPILAKKKLGKPIFFRNIKLEAQIKESGIPLRLTGGLEGLGIDIKSYIDLPLKVSLGHLAFRRKLLLRTSAELELAEVKDNLKKYAPKPFNVLPAPLNVMNGKISGYLFTEKTEGPTAVKFKGGVNLKLKSAEQRLDMEVRGELPFDLADFSRGLLALSLNFKKVAIRMPRLSKTSAPPQFFPDGRIKREREEPLRHPPKKIQAEEERPMVFRLEAHGSEALHLLSNP